MSEPINDESDTHDSGHHSELVEQIVESLKQGNKMQAIKDYRESTGAGLKESKEAIEALVEKYDIKMKSGCASMLLFALSTAILLFIAWGR
ncbi:hypothetical protein [uncultured Gimesia sp.]|jgi:ribosomal protein L7/L12|uniref:hypothetical protein n=1 Tax=uncultured Gimesia sp. TaxID=1678688 RepID=UPI0026119C08|nr:hypothetical protein [uncultured Gimesia sp.]